MALPPNPSIGTACFRLKGRNCIALTFLVALQVLNFQSASSLRDDWYGFVSFEDTSEWMDAYSYTCDHGIDLFREPREFTQREHLRGKEELLTPVRFRSKDTKPSPENTTLHIYNPPGIRKAHTVSYGFQRNKECLHGQDSKCVVLPEIARVRALVLSADRFAGKLNLNYIKDNFLIEQPERYVTILNGGSIFERKFYEAVFLGGYTKDPRRSSHQIDGKKYPLEIYMYFLDETVPSVSLSTILVVLVEESERDNIFIKPVINAIEHHLYDKDRRFLAENKALIRRERLFHHLQASTRFDVYNSRQYAGAVRDEIPVQDSLDSSIEYEGLLTKYVEPFERMQAMEAELYFLQEDHTRVMQSKDENGKFSEAFMAGTGNELLPSSFDEYKYLGLVTLMQILRRHNQGGMSCSMLAQTLSKTLKQSGAHKDELVKLTTNICELLVTEYLDLSDRNHNHTEMLSMTLKEKRQFIQKFVKFRKDMGQLNNQVYDHFHGRKRNSFHRNITKENPNYANPQQRYHIVDGIFKLILFHEKGVHYEAIKKDLTNAIDMIAKRLGYEDIEEMEDVMQYLNFGSSTGDLTYDRYKLHHQFANRILPDQEKKRALVEFGGMEMSEEDIKAYEQLSPVTATVNEEFQISWLIPPDGGYYYYDGSSPLPPCFRAQNVIVFKRPITMSRRQIEILSRVPTTFDRSEDIRSTTPLVHDTKFQVELSGPDTEQSRMEEIETPIYNQARNHLFLGHDGVHKNVVEEWEAKMNKKNTGAKVIEDDRLAVMIVGLVINLVIYTV